MAFGGATPGATALKPGQAQNLVSALSAQAGPANPKTENERKDPREEQLLNLQRVRRSLEIFRDSLDDGDPVGALIGNFHSAITRLRDGVKLETVMSSLLAAISPPPIVAGGMGMPPGGPPPPGAMPPTAGGPPPGMPPPVSPGPPGQ